MWDARDPILSKEALILSAETKILRSLATGDWVPRILMTNSSRSSALRSLLSLRARASSARATSEFRKALEAFSIIVLALWAKATSRV